LYDARVAPGFMQSSVITTQGHDFKLNKKMINCDLLHSVSLFFLRTIL